MTKGWRRRRRADVRTGAGIPCGVAVTYNEQQWIDSFEGRLAILRPHLSERVLASMALAAWHRRGVRGEEPVAAAQVECEALDAAPKKAAR